MAIWSIDGETGNHDVRHERIAQGSIGGGHIIPRSIPGNAIKSVVDDQDPRITYGILDTSTTQDLTLNRAGSFDFNGTSTSWTNLGCSAQFKFTGTSIGVLARTSPKCSDIDVYIDGSLTPGRTLYYNQLLSIGVDATNGYSNLQVLSSSATSVYIAALGNFLTTGGTILIDRELISYQTATANSAGGYVLNNCTRGVNGTTATTHDWSAIAYWWDYNATLNSGVGVTSYSLKNLVYFNPFLSPGNHIITIVLRNRTGMPNTAIFFDGFLTGPLVGAESVYVRLGTATIGVNTDGNGYNQLGSLSTTGGVTILGVMGWQQTSPDPASGGTSCKLVPLVNTNSGDLMWALANGPLSTAITGRIWFMYLGEGGYV